MDAKNRMLVWLLVGLSLVAGCFEATRRPVAPTPHVQPAEPAPVQQGGSADSGIVVRDVRYDIASMPPEIQAELIDQPTLAYGYRAAPPGGQFADPHDDPVWSHNRRQFAHDHCCCMVTGCTDDPDGDAVHHGLGAKWCVAAGHYELAIGPGPGQRFYRLCQKHHAEIGHGIGRGGNWKEFNLDIEADVKAGRWNSRGKSAWTFRSDAEAIAWVKDQIQSANGSGER